MESLQLALASSFHFLGFYSFSICIFKYCIFFAAFVLSGLAYFLCLDFLFWFILISTNAYFFVLFSSNPSSDYDFHDFHRNVRWTISDHYLNLNRSTGLTSPGGKNNPWASKTSYFTKTLPNLISDPNKAIWWFISREMYSNSSWCHEGIGSQWSPEPLVRISQQAYLLSHFEIPRLDSSRGVMINEPI